MFAVAIKPFTKQNQLVKAHYSSFKHVQILKTSKVVWKYSLL